MSPYLEETIILDVVTSHPTTGVALDADSISCEVFEDANDTAVLSPVVTKRAGKAGDYRIPVACTAANNFSAGKTYNVVATATVNGVGPARLVVDTFQVRPSLADSLGRVTLAPTGMDAISTTLNAAPTTFPQWIMWFILRFRRSRLTKSTGILSVYGSNGSTIITNQTTTDDTSQETVGVTQ